MKKLALIALALFAANAEARDSIRFDLSLQSLNTYARQGAANSFEMRHSQGSMSGNLSASIGGRTASQAIPATQQSGEAKGRLDVLSPTLIRMVGADGNSVDVKARVSADGSIYAEGRHLARAVRAMIAPQLAAIQQQLEGKGQVSLDIRARDLSCAPKADGLVCSMAASISLSAVQY